MAVNWNFELTNVALFAGAIVVAVYSASRGNAREQSQAGGKREKSGTATAGECVAVTGERWESETVMAAIAELQALIHEVENRLADHYP